MFLNDLPLDIVPCSPVQTASLRSSGARLICMQLLGNKLHAKRGAAPSLQHSQREALVELGRQGVCKARSQWCFVCCRSIKGVQPLSVLKITY